MLNYDLIVIGFGKAGKTLAAKMNAAGKKVAVIERSKAMYGGTCINIACIPTKTMIVAAEKGWSLDSNWSTCCSGLVFSKANLCQRWVEEHGSWNCSTCFKVIATIPCQVIKDNTEII